MKGERRDVAHSALSKTSKTSPCKVAQQEVRQKNNDRTILYCDNILPTRLLEKRDRVVISMTCSDAQTVGFPIVSKMVTIKHRHLSAEGFATGAPSLDAADLTRAATCPEVLSEECRGVRLLSVPSGANANFA